MENVIKKSKISIFSSAIALIIALSMAFTFMPAKPFAARADGDPVEYTAWNGTALGRRTGDDACKTYASVTSSTTDWTNGWYVVKSSAVMNSRVTVTGEVNLIICDGRTLNANAGITVTAGNTLNIYGQTGNIGTLIVNDVDENYAAIGGGNGEAGGTVNIHGCEITAIGGRYAAGIGGGNGGTGGSVNVYGGDVTATGGKSGAGMGGGNAAAGGTVNVLGGVVTASGGQDSVGIGAGKGYTIHGALNVGYGIAVYGGWMEDPNVMRDNYANTRWQYMVIMSPSTYSVTLHTNGGTINGGNVTEYKEYTGVVLPTDVTKDGYVFAGWFEKEDLSGSSVTAISPYDAGDKEFWAKWVHGVDTAYYLVGNMNGWEPSEAYKLKKNSGAEAAEYYIDIDLTTSSQFKIFEVKSQEEVWYPAYGNNYGQNGEIKSADPYRVYFRPNYDGGSDWFGGCIYIVKLHTHNYSTGWTKGETTHWHACLNEGCDAPKADEAAHTYSDNINATSYYTCSVCGYEDGQRKKAYDAEQEVKAAIAKINAIGTVTYTPECKGKIDDARDAYDALTDGQKAQVDNYETLTNAEEAYAEFKRVADQAADQAAADAVKVKINDIGLVEYTAESKEKIDEARNAYDALTANQKSLVDNYGTLWAAESNYEMLKSDAEQFALDLAAAEAVQGKINDIGLVEYTAESKAKIDEARNAYDALTDDRQLLVNNYHTLSTAEERYAELKAEAEKYAADKAIAETVQVKINAVGTVEYSDASKAKLDEAQAAYDALTDDQKALVENRETLVNAKATYEALKSAADNQKVTTIVLISVASAVVIVAVVLIVFFVLKKKKAQK